jgi:hypothetical protein
MPFRILKENKNLDSSFIKGEFWNDSILQCLLTWQTPEEKRFVHILIGFRGLKIEQETIYVFIKLKGCENQVLTFSASLWRQ